MTRREPVARPWLGVRSLLRLALVVWAGGIYLVYWLGYLGVR
jgi:hypothetical protein